MNLGSIQNPTIETPRNDTDLPDGANANERANYYWPMISNLSDGDVDLNLRAYSRQFTSPIHRASANSPTDVYNDVLNDVGAPHDSHDKALLLSVRHQNGSLLEEYLFKAGEFPAKSRDIIDSNENGLVFVIYTQIFF